MSNLVCLIGDLHYGEKGNSEKFNQQVNLLLEFAVSEAKKRSCKTCIQLGDWHHDRSKINVSTMNYSIAGAKTLQNGFDDVLTIVSNHDIYHRDRIDINSMEMLKPYLTVIDTPTVYKNSLLVPWVVSGEDWDSMITLSKKEESEYLFAHLELNDFKVNDNYTMEHGFSPKSLSHFKHVYTGHYHTPQTKNNITYCGTPYPISMNEANGQHGIYFLDLDTGACEFVEFELVKVISIPYTDIDILEHCDPEFTYVRIEFPDDLEDETIISDVQKFLEENHFVEHKIQYTDSKTKQILSADVSDVKEVENIDEVVVSFIENSADISGVDKNLLAEIYKEAKERGQANA